ncbi:hypothetical protein J3R83DRAFT_3927, partial [Lanmaoa asiatica]
FQKEGTCISHNPLFALFLAFNQALARDGYRRMITGLFNVNSLLHCAELRAIAKRDHVMGVTVQTCHILNESTMRGINLTGISKQSGPSITLTRYPDAFYRWHYGHPEMFGFSEFTEAFKRSGGFHQVWNLLSLEPKLHSKSDRLDLWFESTHQPDRYKVCVFDEEVGTYIRKVFVGPKPHVDGAPMFVKFTSKIRNSTAAQSPLTRSSCNMCSSRSHVWCC